MHKAYMYMLSIMLIILITDHVEIKFREMKVEKKYFHPPVICLNI